MKILVGIQARTDSSRLPCKSFLDFYGHTLIERVYQSCAASELSNHIYLLTSDRPVDDYMVSRYSSLFANKVFRGSAFNIPSRYHSLVLRERADAIVRVTGDNPLTDYRLINSLVHHFQSDVNQSYLLHNMYKIVEGFGVELFSATSLQLLASNEDPKILDSPGLYYVNNSGKTIVPIDSSCDNSLASKFSATVDTLDDYLNLLSLGQSFWDLAADRRVSEFVSTASITPGFKYLRKHYRSR
jgi:spore coat polysaccharide biosynthesis protein SpsF